MDVHLSFNQLLLGQKVQRLVTAVADLKEF